MTTRPAACNWGEGQHPHDIAAEELQRALAEATRPDLLRELATTARAVFGFFPDHYPHTLNYPWVLERLEPLPPGARVLDVGAGVSPLPIVLARRGLRVDCVDRSETCGTMPVTADWNEWGFFDYSVVDVGIQSYHRDVREHVPAQPYDRIYSVSVLAHMTRSEREETVGLFPQWLKPGGRLLLAIDLIAEERLPLEPLGGSRGRAGARARNQSDLFNWIAERGCASPSGRSVARARLADRSFVRRRLETNMIRDYAFNSVRTSP